MFKQLESKLAKLFLFPKKTWVQAQIAAGVTNEKMLVNNLCKEDFT